jgi:mannose-1-phosphate guanylyltransferase
MDRVEKPWGYYIDIVREPTTVFKKIVIKPGQAISYQVHDLRSEFWLIESGNGLFKFSTEESPLLNYSVREVKAGDFIEVHSGVAHQLRCLGDSELCLWELQYGVETSENDIRRLEDPYNRN